MPVPSAIECVSGENKRNQPTNTLCLLILLNHLFFVQCTRKRTSFYPTIKFLPGWGSGQYGPYGDPAGPGTPAQGEPVARKGRQSSRREPRTPFFSKKNTLDYISCVSSNVLSSKCLRKNLLQDSSANVLFLYSITHFYVCDCETFNNLSVRLVLFII
jgi:hypothetical protein